MLSDIKMLEYTLSENELDFIKQFYKQSWALNSDYIVYGDIKSLKFNSMIFSHHYKDALAKKSSESKTLKNIRENKFITAEGLITHIDEFARCYESGIEFPKISVIYLIIESGDKVAEFYYNFRRTLIEFLKSNNINFNTTDLDAKLLESINIYTYIKREGSLLIDGTLNSKIVSTLDLDDNKYYRYLFDLDRVLSDCDKYQTLGFYPSFFIDFDYYDKLHAHLSNELCSRHWSYDFRLTSIYDTFIIGNNGIKGYYGFYVIPGNRLKYSITPYIMWNKLYDSEIQKLSNEIANELKKLKGNYYDKLIHLLLSEDKYLKPTKMRTLCIIFSISLFSFFIRPIRDKLGTIEYNLKAISLYLGTQSENIEALERIYGNRELCSLLYKIVIHNIKNSTSVLSTEIPSEVDYGSTSKVESYIANRRLKYYKELKDRQQTSREYNSTSNVYHPEAISLDEYINSSSKYEVSIIDKLLMLIIMMKSGNIEIQPNINKDSSGFKIITTESAKILIFKPYYRFIPSILKLISNKPKDVTLFDFIEAFGDFIADQENDEQLGKELRQFIENIDAAGIELIDKYGYGSIWLDVPNIEEGIRVLKEWNKEPWSSEEVSRFRFMSSDVYTKYEKEIQNKYVKLVDKFLEQYNEGGSNENN